MVVDLDRLASLAEAILPPGSGLPSPRAVKTEERLIGYLAELPRQARLALEASFRVLDRLPILFGRASSLTRLPLEERCRILERVARSVWGRALIEPWKFLVAGAYASSPEVEAVLGFTGECLAHAPAAVGPRLSVISWPEAGPGTVVRADVVVVGSGAGGAAAAWALAREGLSVVVLEEGGYYTTQDFQGPPFERVLKLYRDAGTTLAFGVPPIPLPLGKAVGGTTVVNSGTCFRAPARVLERWEREYGLEGAGPADMAPLFDEVEAVIGVRPAPWELLGENAYIFHRGAEALGLRGRPLLRNIRGCRGCGLCAFGCPSGAKQAVHLNFLPQAEEAGARIYARARADGILFNGSRVSGVEATLLDQGEAERGKMRVLSEAVVLAAGAVHTPVLLSSHGLGGPAVGKYLRIHPAVGMPALFSREVYAWRGTLQSYLVDAWEGDGIMMEVTNPVPGIHGGLAPGVGPAATEYLAAFPRIASAGFMVADTSTGRVVRGRRGNPVITYWLNHEDTARIQRGMVRMAEIFMAAGARAVVTGLPGSLGVLRDRSDLARLAGARIRRRWLHLSAYHPTGTARMGRDPATSVTDPWGRVRGVEGLVVADASLFPTCLGVNPQVTIMAFALRNARALARDLCRRGA